MDWDEVREKYPGRWVVVEAYGAYTRSGQRVIPRLEVVGVYDDWREAWEQYERLHDADRRREHYYLHTGREALNIGVLDRFGRKVEDDGEGSKLEAKHMDWQAVREKYPSKWVVVEAYNAYTQGGQRVIPRLEVVGVYDTWHEAWEQYKRLHSADRQREYYPLHTDREALNIGVLDAFRRKVTN